MTNIRLTVKHGCSHAQPCSGASLGTPLPPRYRGQGALFDLGYYLKTELAEEHVETLTIPLAWQCVPPNRRLSCSVRRPSASDAAARASFHCRAERASSRGKVR